MYAPVSENQSDHLRVRRREDSEGMREALQRQSSEFGVGPTDVVSREKALSLSDSPPHEFVSW